MSYQYVSDDQVVPYVNYEVQSDVEESSGGEVDLQELATSAQRLVVSRCAREHVAGAVKSVSAHTGKWTGEKMFRIDKLVEWTSGEPSVLVEELRKGRLRCRLSAAMGMGKSTKMPSYLARELDIRVLYVTLNTVALQQMIDYVHSNRIGRVRRQFTERRREWLCGMTYGDFCGFMASSERAQMFRNFELIIFDEAFMDTAEVFVAKRAFAAYSLSDSSLILCSATIKKAESIGDLGGAKDLGSFQTINRAVQVDEVISSGKFCTEFLADRSAVYVPDDATVASVTSHYVKNGVEAYALDSASTYEDFARVNIALQGDSSTPRVMVAHSQFGIALNSPVSQPLIFPFESKTSFTGGGMVQELEPMTDAYVTQCMSRSGRGITEGSTGVVFGPGRREAKELRDGDKMRAFVKMFSINLVPSKNGFWEEQYSLFPKGLSHTLANSLVKICLPIEVAIRYFASEDKVAAKYRVALNCFSQPNHFLMASPDELPKSHSTWVRESMVTNADRELCVPLHTVGEVQVIVQAIEFIASGTFVVERWSPQAFMKMDDGYDSGDDVPRERLRAVPNLRRVRDVSPVRQPVKEELALPWQYESAEDKPRRTAGIIDSARIQEALARMEASLASYKVESPKVEEELVVDVGEVDDASREVPIKYGDGVVESPGGNEVCVLPLAICEKVNMGIRLQPEEAVILVSRARVDVTRFVASKLFDGFSRPWDSLIQTMLDDRALSCLARRGLASDGFHIIDQLRGRFSLETANVLAHSNIYKKRFFRVFQKLPSFESVMKAVAAGKFDMVAQTEGFLNRVRYLKRVLDETILGSEKLGMYLPRYVTAAQEQVPLRGENVLGYRGEGLYPMSASMSRQIQSRSRGGPDIKYPLSKDF